MEKRGQNQFFLPRHTAKLSIIPSPFGMPLQNFIWEHKIYYCTCKSICLISHQRTDPTVEYSRKNGTAVKQLPNAIRTKIHSFNIRLRDSEKNSLKAKLFFMKAIYKQVCLHLRGQNKGRILNKSGTSIQTAPNSNHNVSTHAPPGTSPAPNRVPRHHPETTKPTNNAR